MTWFQDLTGIELETPKNVGEYLSIDGSKLCSSANGKRFEIGELTTPSLSALRASTLPFEGSVSICEIVDDVQRLHTLPENAGAVFQVASQFNLLEMIGPSIGPEDGVTQYEDDLTQGPACAIACGAGTIYRNYFVPVGGVLGQSRDRQIDCLEDIARALRNKDQQYWEMQNGYVLPTAHGLTHLNRVLEQMSDREINELRGMLRIGLQSETEVTLKNAGHRVTQVYCSAMPVSYSGHPREMWKLLATLVLEAAYEATLLAALKNSNRIGNNKVFLTMLGGGAFGNDDDWIINAILRAIRSVSKSNLEINLVSYRKPSFIANEVITRFRET